MIPVSNPLLGELERDNLLHAIEKGEISSQGTFVRKFEEAFAEYCQVPHAVTVSNGTVALHLALVAMDIGPGDEVIVPAFTFVSTANAVVHAGAKPVFADIEPTSWCIDPNDVLRKITNRTKGIIPVHLYGHPANMKSINHIAEENSIIVLEDAAEAHGAKVMGKKVGSLGHAATFSFYGNKIITTGEGGAITTHDNKLADRLRMLRDHGKDSSQPYWHSVIGYNYRLTNLQAAVGLAQLSAIDIILERKSEIMERYYKGLKGLPLQFQPHAPWAEPVVWLVTIMLKNDAPISASDLCKKLAQKGIDTRPLFIPLPMLPMYSGTNGKFPITDNIYKCGLNLPSGPNISDADIDYVINTIRAEIS